MWVALGVFFVSHPHNDQNVKRCLSDEDKVNLQDARQQRQQKVSF